MQENLLSTPVAKITLLFIFIFLSCKDIYISIILLLGILILYNLFNEYSKFNILPTKVKNLTNVSEQ